MSLLLIWRHVHDNPNISCTVFIARLDELKFILKLISILVPSYLVVTNQTGSDLPRELVRDKETGMEAAEAADRERGADAENNRVKAL